VAARSIAVLANVVHATASPASAWIGLIREVVVSPRLLLIRVQCRRTSEVPADWRRPRGRRALGAAPVRARFESAEAFARSAKASGGAWYAASWRAALQVLPSPVAPLLAEPSSLHVPTARFDDFLGGQLVVGVVENVIEGLRWSSAKSRCSTGTRSCSLRIGAPRLRTMI